MGVERRPQTVFDSFLKSKFKRLNNGQETKYAKIRGRDDHKNDLDWAQPIALCWVGPLILGLLILGFLQLTVFLTIIVVDTIVN